MTEKPRDFRWVKSSRRKLKLTCRELGEMLDTDMQTARRLERDPEYYSTARPLAPRMVRLIEAYLSGYRPPDWPKK